MKEGDQLICWTANDDGKGEAPREHGPVECGDAGGDARVTEMRCAKVSLHVPVFPARTVARKVSQPLKSRVDAIVSVHP